MKAQSTLCPVWVACLFLLAQIRILSAANPSDMTFHSRADGSEQRYAILLPPHFNGAQPHDVLIALHGHGADRWQFIADPRAECRALRDVAARFGLVLVAPDYRARTSWMGPKAEEDVLQIIAELRMIHQVGRVFIAGGSMGGTGALIFTALHPQAIAGVCALNPTANLIEYQNFQDAIRASYGGTKAEVPEEYRARSPELRADRFTMPVAITTGGKDQLVPPASALRLAGLLQAANRRVLSLHRDATGHSTNYEDSVEALEFVLLNAGLARPAATPPVATTDTSGLSEKAGVLSKKLAALPVLNADLKADAEIFQKGISWALRYDTPSSPDVVLIHKALDRGMERLEALARGRTDWARKKGKLVRGFVSSVDGSVQPYGLVIPQHYTGAEPMRLDVVLHGSSKPHGMSELRFISRFDEGDNASEAGPTASNFIELHPLGRVENCYRWAGETDVFEAIEAVCRNYNIDVNRIVLRGMSMGASGTWHLGLKHPDRFVALGPYCGYVDTHRFSETPIPGFIKVGPLPPHQELGLHMLDSVDYAANAGVVPAIAAIGDKDTFFQSHVHMEEAFQKEGLQMVNLISHGTGHVQDPATHQEQMRRIGERAAAGLNHQPTSLRFVTWTLKYNRCHWVRLLGLEKHYSRAEFAARLGDDGALEVSVAGNIQRFAISRPLVRVRILGQEVALPAAESKDTLVFSRTQNGWRCDGPLSAVSFSGKSPGLQGPVDDAFASPFLCVRGTGKAWNPDVQYWAEASLRRFEYEWARYMRGTLPVKDDTAVTDADLKEKHLILFGDPGSNVWIAKALPSLPLVWNPSELKFGGATEASAQHAPALVCANPLSPGRYLVLNSGHTFHEKEFAAFNYLLFPRHGDWAVMKILPEAQDWKPEMKAFPEEVLRSGYFDEQWRNASTVTP
jgi:pimeloyl-ACP methyl ester carboxylesterase